MLELLELANHSGQLHCACLVGRMLKGSLGAKTSKRKDMKECRVPLENARGRLWIGAPCIEGWKIVPCKLVPMHNYVQTIFSSWLSPAPFPAALFDSSPQQALASLPQAMKLMADFIHKHPTAYPTTSIMTVLVVANYGAQVDTDLSFGACSFQPNPISTKRQSSLLLGEPPRAQPWCTCFNVGGATAFK